ncbi:MAG: signal peptidase II [Bacillota bacterium]|nr:MAG: signal peptidase II [Bacillota bacterium]MBS3949670.1 signal peptidase II [Peptococcaceae bacterium]
MNLALVIAGLVVVLDQLTKYAVVQLLPYLSSRPVIPGVFYFTHVRNVGAAFGLFAEQRVLFIVAFVLITVAFFVFRSELRQLGMLALVASGLVLGGALGNAIDRVWLGYVVDFFDFKVWPVFNVADSAIVVGSILLAFCVMRADGK